MAKQLFTISGITITTIYYVMRSLSPLDTIINEVNQSLNTLWGQPAGSQRTNPATETNEPNNTPTHLSEAEQRLAGALMRINHAGEVAAQGLYRGQALNAKEPHIKQQMEQSAIEENDHLKWCDDRLSALNSRKSFLNPIWYSGSFTIGAIAGRAGDQWSLGFVKETENQVVKHLEKHAMQWPKNDIKSLAVIKQMAIDEAHHARIAEQAGAKPLPLPIRKILMPSLSSIMTRLSYHI